MERLDWLGVIERGKLTIDDEQDFEEAIKLLFDSTDPIRASIRVEKLGRRRTLRQIRYLFGVVYAIALKDEQFRGWTKDEIHGHYKDLILKRTKELNGEIVEIAGSTKRLKTVELTDFIEGVRRDLGQEHGIDTPNPGEYA